jgi:hypothetical protein
MIAFAQPGRAQMFSEARSSRLPFKSPSLTPSPSPILETKRHRFDAHELPKEGDALRQLSRKREVVATDSVT